MKTYLLLPLFFLITSSVSAQTGKSAVDECVANRSAATETTLRWAAHTRVTVYAQRNNFSAAQIMTIRQAINNWNAALAETDANVQFSFGGERDGASPDASTITINRAPTYQNARHLAEILPVLENAQLLRAEITIDPGVTDSEVLTSVLAHELGHSLGMDDCPKCRRGTTLMALYRGRNRGNKALFPTPCDRRVVASAYQPASQPKIGSLAQSADSRR